MIRKLILLTAAYAVSFALTGCNDGGADKTPAVPVPPARAWDAAYQAEVEAFAKKLEGYVKKGDAASFNNLLDMTHLGDEVTKGLDLSAKDKADLTSGFKASIDLGTQLGKNTSLGGSYHYIRCRYEDGHPVAIFRILDARSNLNYHQLILRPDPAAQFIIEDLKAANTGELFSVTLRNLSMPMLVENNRNLISKLALGEGEYVKNLPKIMQMTEQLRTGKNAEVLQTYASLPQSMRVMKALLLMRLKAASAVSTQEYTQAMNDAQTTLAGDTCLDLLLIDSYFFKNDFVHEIQCLDNLEKTFGADAHLKFLRAFSLDKLNKHAEARDEARAAIATEPQYLQSYGILLKFCQEAKVNSEILDCLVAMEKAGMDVGGVDSRENFKDFRASPDYKLWQARKRTAPTPAPK